MNPVDYQFLARRQMLLLVWVLICPRVLNKPTSSVLPTIKTGSSPLTEGFNTNFHYLEWLLLQHCVTQTGPIMMCCFSVALRIVFSVTENLPEIWIYDLWV